MRFAPSDFRGLSVFRAVVDNGGFIGAQLALGISPSTLSFHLKALEERLGFDLCRRGRGGFQLTERGRETYEASKALAAAISDFESRLGELRNEVTGTLRVGVVANTVSDPGLPLDVVMNDCLRHAPQADVQLLIADPEVLMNELARDGIDIALTPPMGLGRGFHERLFYYEMHALYCSNVHALFDIPVSKLSKELISEHEFVVRSYGNKTEIAHYPTAKVRIQASTMEAIAILVLSGQVIGYLPEHYAGPFVAAGRLRKISSVAETFSSPFMIVSKGTKQQTPLQRVFVRELRRRCPLPS